MAGRYDVSLEQLAALLAGEAPYRVRQVWDGMHRRATPPAELTELPGPLRARLAEHPALQPALRVVTESRADSDQTIKWLWRLADGAAVETVLMKYPERATVCVSTQAGCAMGCTFCATGQAGFTRHLTPGEIIEQVVVAIGAARPHRVSNVVFMGMGEPLANYDAMWSSVERLHDHIGISARHLTVSTVGLVPGIRRLATERLPVNLAVSLHAANDALRDTMIPINRRWPLAVLTEACREYLARKGRRLSFEWAMIDGVNDKPSDAAELAAIARPLAAHVNLIPLNPTPGYPTRGTGLADVRAFRVQLLEMGVNATVRHNRGSEIDAACGQLAAGQSLRPLSRSRVPH